MFLKFRIHVNLLFSGHNDNGHASVKLKKLNCNYHEKKRWQHYSEYIKLFCSFRIHCFLLLLSVIFGWVDFQTDSYLSRHRQLKRKLTMWRWLMKYVIFHAYLAIASQCVVHTHFFPIHFLFVGIIQLYFITLLCFCFTLCQQPLFQIFNFFFTNLK